MIKKVKKTYMIEFLRQDNKNDLLETDYFILILI
jgi:hypothetical protein